MRQWRVQAPLMMGEGGLVILMGADQPVIS